MFLGRRAILVVEADATRQASVCAALTQGGFKVEEARHVDQALALLTTRRFDALLAAIELPERSGLELLRSVRERALPVPVALTTVAPLLETAVTAMRFGAVDYLTVPMASAELLARVGEAVRKSAELQAIAEAKQQAAHLTLSAGALEASLSRTLPPSSSRLRAAPRLTEAPDTPEAGPLSRLSPREREIAELLMEGNAVSEMAATLALSPNTVRNHVKSIFGKLRVHSQVELLSRLSGRSR